MDSDSGPTASMIFFVVLLLVDIFCYGFVAALDALNEKEVERRAKEEKDRKAIKLQSFLDNPTKYTNTVQLITTLTNVIIGAVHFGVLLHGVMKVVEMIAKNGLDKDGISAGLLLVISVVLSTMLLLYIVLTLGVLIPRKIAVRKPEKWAYACVGPVYFLTKLFAPFTGLIMVTAKGILRIFGINDSGNELDVTEEEIINILNEGHEQGVIQASEAEMISNIFELGEKEASDIMTHRRNMVAVEGDKSLEDVFSLMIEENYSRYPVYEEDVDHIIGILHMKDVMRCYAEGSRRKTPVRELKDLLREAYFVPGSKNINDLFRELQANKLQMAIVVDEYGQTDGLVAMEDILEEIVGNILDEYDDESEHIEEKGKDEYVIDGMTPLEELEEQFAIDFDEEESETLSGFLVSKMERIPEPGDDFELDYKGFHFKLLTVEDKIITSVLVTKLPEETMEETADIEE